MKKVICLLIISVFLALSITGCSGKSESFEIKYDENNVGEIYAAEIDPEHIAIGESEIKYVDNEVLLVAQNEVSKNEIKALAKDIDAEIVGYIEQTGDYQLKFSQAMTEKEVVDLIADLNGNSLIGSASFNYVFDIDTISVDYNINDGEKWSTGSTPNLWQGPLLALLLKNDKAWGVNAINAPLAWSMMNTIKEKINPVNVGLIDKGFDETHEDLTFKQVFYENGANSVDIADEFHGTHVAGTMAARGDNKDGICGVYQYSNGRLYAASWSGANEYKLNQYSSSSFIDMVCLAELVLRNVKVINASYGFANYAIWYNDEGRINSTIESAKHGGDFLKRLLAKGYDFVIVVAAGNDSTKREHLDSTYCTLYAAIPNDEEYKDVYNRIIVVGAVGKTLDISAFSNTGERTEIYAPGEEIYSTVPGNDYSYDKGTSMAAPHVAGVVANVWSIDNGLSGDEVKRIVCSSVNANSKDGVPVVDCAVAVKKAIEGNADVRMDEVQNGGILGWVFDGDDRSTPIENVSVVPYSIGIALTDYGVTTDEYGHFELIIPAGKYDLHFVKKGYEEKVLSAESINGSINYFNEGIDEVIGLDEFSDTIFPTQYFGLTLKELKQLLGNDCIYSPNGHGIFYFKFETSPYYFVFATSNYNDIIQILDGDASILDDVKLSVVSISTQEESTIIPNQIYTNRETYNSLKTKSTKMLFSEDTIWGTICDINVDGFLIRYVWQQGYSSDKIADYVLLYQKDDISDSSNHTNINDEERLKNIISNYGIIGAWHYADYDGNGDKEAFAVIISDNDENSRPIDAIYYIDSTGKTHLMNDDIKWSLYINQNGCYRECSGKGFFWFDMGAYGSGWRSAIYSVKNGTPYELDISQNIQGFYQDGNNIFYTTKDEFLLEGGHINHDYELIFNGSTQQFSVGNKIDVAYQTTESDDNSSLNTGSTENQTAEKLRRNIVGDWVEYSFDENGKCYFYGDHNNSGTYEITENKTLIIKFPWTQNTYTWSDKSFNEFHEDHDYDEYFWFFTTEGVLRLNGTNYYRNGVFFSSD